MHIIIKFSNYFYVNFNLKIEMPSSQPKYRQLSSDSKLIVWVTLKVHSLQSVSEERSENQTTCYKGEKNKNLKKYIKQRNDKYKYWRLYWFKMDAKRSIGKQSILDKHDKVIYAAAKIPSGEMIGGIMSEGTHLREKIY